jgi:hypothetical protein
MGWMAGLIQWLRNLRSGKEGCWDGEPFTPAYWGWAEFNSILSILISCTVIAISGITGFWLAAHSIH